MEKVKLGEIFEYLPKSKFKAGDGKEKGKYKFFTSSNIQNKYIDEFVYDGEYIIFGTGGKASINYCNDKFSTSTDNFVVKVNKAFCAKLIYLYFKNDMAKLEKGFKGASIKHISKEYINQLTIPKYNYEEQLRIVNELDKVQKIIDIREKQIEELDELIKSQFVETFGDPVSNEKQWKKAPLGDECNIITGNTPSRNKKEYYGDFIEWIKSDNINTPSNYITQAEEYLSEEGEKVGRTINENSILMTCIAGSISCIGNVAMTNRKVAFNQQINGIETLKNNTIFMYMQFLLSKEYIKSTINMSLKGILSKGKLSELEFIFPPIELQNQFAQKFQQIDKQKYEIQKSLEEIQKLQESLMNKYFG